MFYSHDLLGRKSTLGAIWTMAHGKKLSKCKILGINVMDVCKQIMQPDVPHSLRLQGILIGGVVIVFNKQQIYLLEDLQEMLRKVRAASAPEAAALAAANTVLQKGKDRARAEAITLADDQLGGGGGGGMMAGGIGGFGEWGGMGDLADLEQHMLVLPTEELMKGFRDLDDLADPDEEAAERAAAKQARRRGRGYAGADGAVGGAAAGGGADDAAACGDEDADLLVAPTLAPQSGTEGLSNRLTGGSGSHKLPTQNQPFHSNNFEDADVFEAPDLELMMDPDTEGAGDAVFLALGGFGRDRSKSNTGTNNASAGPSNTKTAAGTSAAGAAGGSARGPGSRAAEDSMMDLFEAPSDLLLQDLIGELPGAAGAAAAAAGGGGAAAGGARRSARRAAGVAGEITEGSEEGGEDELDEEEERQQKQKPSRSMSVSVPFPMVEQPQEHSVPPSPMQDDDMFPMPNNPNDLVLHGLHGDVLNNNSQEPPQPQPTGSEGGFGFATAAAAGGAAAAAAAMGQKRRRTSDEDNDSASEASLSALLANSPRQQQDQQGVRGRAQQAPRRDGTAAKPARRRAGAKVTLDDDTDTLVRTSLYREWTLDSRPLLVSPMGATRNRRLSAGASASPIGLRRRRVLFAAGTAAPTSGSTNGQSAGPPGVGLNMDAAVGAALAAGDSDAVTAAVLRAPAVALGLGFRSLGWAPPLLRLLELAADGRPAAEIAAAEAAAAAAAAATAATDDNEGDGRGAKRQRKAKTAAAARLATAAGGTGVQHAAAAAADAEPSLMVSEASDLRARQTQSAERLGDSAGFLAAQGEEQMHMPLPEEEDEMGFQEEDMEMERLRAEDTPDGQRLHAQQRAALGLTPGGAGAGGSSGAGRGTLRDLLLGATGGRAGSSRATGTTGTTHSSGLLGRESETDGGSAHGGSRRGGRGSGGGPLGLLRFGTGALEDLLPAIDEGAGVGLAEDHMMMDEEEDLTLPPSERATSGGNGSGSNALRSSRLRAGSTQQPGSGTAGASGGPGGEFVLRETYGQTQVLPGDGGGAAAGAAMAYMSRNTSTVISIFRQRLSMLAAAHHQHQQLHQQQQAPSGADGATTTDRAAPSASAGTAAAGAAAGATAAITAPPAAGLSFFSLACELTRPEAVKLFYQTLVTHTTGFVRASQAEPYGDIIIMPGRHM
ncbi:hypothetical protein HYH02_014655 [Chlamydomonas schloesseri]|uniref:Rad21/Rec8-like protein N-terminal domain-containing protein n=1 Tax=Chlamydomonas schloesseri TaxID=2026947 RepID=A0A835SRL8_9CHLO|nr:hypothetical protein HYH02_014655 [Chlamydomonas schloesseri]|eukprot:KAG2427009.1 hypothetical protein HYH02_014655 [Chlamydomonas schloesseri]